MGSHDAIIGAVLFMLFCVIAIVFYSEFAGKENERQRIDIERIRAEKCECE